MSRLFRYGLCVIALLCTTHLTSQELKQGVMSKKAGTGVRGHTGDGGPADKATLSEPFACDVDSAGNVYIAEATNHCIRKVERATGKISTVAGTGKKGYSGDGGKATDATFNEPYAVAVTKDN